MDLIDEKFQQHMYEKFTIPSRGAPKHQPLESNDNRCGKDGGDIRTMTFGQAIVYYLSTQLAHKENKNRGFLVWHSTGSGKMCAAATVLQAFSKTQRKVFYVTTAALNTASHKKFEACASSLFGLSVADKLFEYSTYAKIAHRMQRQDEIDTGNPSRVNTSIEGFPKDAVLIFDEVHNLFNPLPTQRSEHEYVLKALISDKYKDIKVVIMTATPGHDEIQLQSLLNIVRDRRKPEIVIGNDLSQFTRSVVGLVSYVNNSKDLSMFPKVLRDDVVETPMHKDQLVAYLEKIMELNEEDAVFNPQSERRYLIGPRKYSNAMFQYDPSKEVAEFSSKANALVEKIKQFPSDKHFVYSAFYENRGSGGGHGVNTIAILLKKDGYTQFTANMAREHVASGTVPTKAKRYAIFTAKELDTESSRSDMLSIVNHPANARGELVHVVLASQGFNEGIDLLSVRHVHLFEPLVSYHAEKQTIGRAVRHCSHAQLRKEFGEWTIRVHRYFSTIPTSSKHTFVDTREIADETTQQLAFDANMAEMLNIDKKVYADARKRIKRMEELEGCLKSAAVDCMLTSAFHGEGTECIFDYKPQK